MLDRLASLAIGFVLIIAAIGIAPPSAVVYASDDSGIVIHRFQAGGAITNTTDHEYIELYNNSSIDIEVSNWCVLFGADTVACISPPDLMTKIFLEAHKSIPIMNPALESNIKKTIPEFNADILFTIKSNLPTTNGSLKLVDQNGLIVDSLGWGTGVGEGTSAPGNITSGKILQRISFDENMLQDTNNNSTDFEMTTAPGTFVLGGLYEQITSVDACPNTPEFDVILPVGYLHDEAGSCYEDLCDNMSGLQKTVPNGYVRESFDCLIGQIKITELLPNTAGSDTGNEYIELHNPSATHISLDGYYLQVGSESKKYTLPPGTIIGPGELTVIKASQPQFTLPNSSSSVALFTPDDILLYETPVYVQPADDEAWAEINGTWQYTNQPTPGITNLPSLSEPILVSEEKVALEPCPPDKIRNPETNRCRNIVQAASSLLPCEIGETRNPETNRCRKIVSATPTLTPCKPGQERNPETNRCRQLASEDTSPVPCQEGYERNPDTNRCRKTTTGSVAGAATFPVTSQAPLHPGILFSLTLLTIAYGIYEYRYDLGNLAHKLRSKHAKNK